MVGSGGASVAISAPVGITLESGDSYVSILPSGVTVHPAADLSLDNVMIIGNRKRYGRQVGGRFGDGL